MFGKQEPLIPGCEWSEDGATLKCNAKKVLKDVDFEGVVEWRKGRDGKLHRYKDAGLPTTVIEELERYVKGR